MAQAVQPEQSGNGQSKRGELAALEAQDGGIQDKNAIASSSAVKGGEGPSSSHDGVSSGASQRVNTTSASNGQVGASPYSPTITAFYSPAQKLAPSTVAQWRPVTNSDEAPADTAATERAPSSTPASTKLPKSTGDSSPSSSEHEKDADLEVGNHRSDSVDSKEVPVEVPVPNQNEVGWDGPNDPQNPMNWPGRWKWSSIAVISAITFLT